MPARFHSGPPVTQLPPSVPERRPKSLALKFSLALMAAVIFALSYYLGNQYARPLLAELQALPLPSPEKVRDFSLADKYGEPFSRDSLRGYWNFVMVGDLHDPGCQDLLRLYVFAWNRLAHDLPLQKKTRVVFMQTSAMETRDMKQAIEFFNPAYTALSGSERELETLTRQMGLPADRPLPSSCSIEKSAVALINPDGFLIALFTGLTDPAVIAHDLEYFH